MSSDKSLLGTSVVYVDARILEMVNVLVQQYKPSSSQTDIKWPVFQSDSLPCTIVQTLKTGQQDTSTFFKISGDVAIRGLPLESAAGIKMDSTSKSHVPKNQLLPLLVPPQTQVFSQSTGAVNTVAKYF